jgi:asparagine synthase (glutamine-hydrolysing)
MCGLLGECSTNLLDSQAFSELLQLSKKRGPDHTDTFRLSGQLQLGFNRLSIIDLTSAGNQPYHSPNNKFVFVFNGEIYNTIDLINQFQLDATTFRSTSDAEVIAHLLELISIEQLGNCLNGMYSLGIYNLQDKELYLLRDFAGIKPMFYSVHQNGIVFASQFDQVYKHKEVKSTLKINEQALKEYFAIGYMQCPNTIYQNIYQLEPGTILKYQFETKEIQKYTCIIFDHKFSQIKETQASTISETDRILNNVVRNQLVSDVHTGTFLSGGIDSPIITAIASNQKYNIESFTVKVSNESLDESQIAGNYARHLGVKNIVAEFSKEDIVSFIDEHFKCYPEPFGDYSSLPTYLICKLAHKNFKVLLSGDGGDELFWGYPRFYHTLKHAGRFKLPRFLRTKIAGLERKLGHEVSYGITANTIGDWVLGQHSFNSVDTLNSFFHANVSYTDELKNYYRYTGSSGDEDLLKWLRWNEYYCHMQRILIKVDRASMGNGLEVRVPFLDKEIIQFAFTISPDIKNTSPKYILKKIMGKYFPSDIINQNKMGFTIDIEFILKEYCKNDFLKLMQSENLVGNDVLNLNSVRNYVDDFYNGKNNNSWGIWIIYAFLKWNQFHQAH